MEVFPTNNDPYVVSKETCGGCKYYYPLSYGCFKACNYTLDTGKFKPLDMKCADCTFKVLGRPPRKKRL